MSRFDLACLLGGRESFEFPALDGAPIVLWAHHPTPEESVAALLEAGIDTNDAGEVEGAGGLTEAIQIVDMYVALARYCIDGADNLDEWPDATRGLRSNGLSALSPEAEAVLLSAADGHHHVLRQIYSRIGQALHDKTKLTEPEGNDSAPQHSGDSPESSGATPTPVSSAE